MWSSTKGKDLFNRGFLQSINESFPTSVPFKTVGLDVNTVNVEGHTYYESVNVYSLRTGE